jgi:hypothetical protein
MDQSSRQGNQVTSLYAVLARQRDERPVELDEIVRIISPNHRVVCRLRLPAIGRKGRSRYWHPADFVVYPVHESLVNQIEVSIIRYEILIAYPEIGANAL